MAARSGATRPAAGACPGRRLMPESAAGSAVLAVEAADHQVDAEAELLIHVAPSAEQHGEPDQVVGGVAGHHLGDPPQLAQLILRPRAAVGAGGEARPPEPAS